MVNVELTSKEIGIIHYLVGLSIAKLEKEKGLSFIHEEVYPLLTKLQEAQENWERTNVR